MGLPTGCDHYAAHRYFVCRDCVLVEMEDMLLEENPDMPRGEARDRVLEWVRRVGEPEH